MAAPGSTHYGYYVISYQFVYVGSRHGILIVAVSYYQFLTLSIFSEKCLGDVCRVLDNTSYGNICDEHYAD